jgi:hypothetical protein
MLTLFAAILSGRQTTYTPRKARISNQHKISYTFLNPKVNVLIIDINRDTAKLKVIHLSHFCNSSLKLKSLNATAHSTPPMRAPRDART